MQTVFFVRQILSVLQVKEIAKKSVKLQTMKTCPFEN